MTPIDTVQLLAVRSTLARLATIARDHPELCGPCSAENEDGWLQTLEDDEMVTQQFGFRLPEELVTRLDEYVEKMRAATPGLEITRADAVRVLLTRALDGETPKKRGVKKAARAD